MNFTRAMTASFRRTATTMATTTETGDNANYEATPFAAATAKTQCGTIVKSGIR